MAWLAYVYAGGSPGGSSQGYVNPLWTQKNPMAVFTRCSDDGLPDNRTRDSGRLLSFQAERRCLFLLELQTWLASRYVERLLTSSSMMQSPTRRVSESRASHDPKHRKQCPSLAKPHRLSLFTPPWHRLACGFLRCLTVEVRCIADQTNDHGSELWELAVECSSIHDATIHGKHTLLRASAKRQWS